MTDRLEEIKRKRDWYYGPVDRKRAHEVPPETLLDEDWLIVQVERLRGELTELEEAFEHSDDPFHEALTELGVPLSFYNLPNACDGSIARLKHGFGLRDTTIATLRVTLNENTEIMFDAAKKIATLREAVESLRDHLDHPDRETVRWGDVARDIIKKALATTGGGVMGAHTGCHAIEATLRAEIATLTASLKEMKMACAACFRVIAVAALDKELEAELKAAGVENGFGKRAGEALATKGEG